MVSEPLGTRTAASLRLASGATTVKVRVGDLGNRLFRAETPEGSGVVPHGSAASLRLVPSNEPGSGAEVDVQLSNRVAWNLTLAGGANDESVDLRGAKLSGLRVTAGVSQLELWLPTPARATTVELSGGASGIRLHVPGGVPTQVSAAAGAGSVDLDGIASSGVPAGQVWTPSDWMEKPKHYDVKVLSGIGWLTLDRV